jgi:uncharacterized protein YegP (UPF0339 family)
MAVSWCYCFETVRSSYQRRYVAAKFVLEKDSAGRFQFRLVSQGRVLASSESYTTKRAAQNAIASVKSGAATATVEDTTQPETPAAAPGRPVKAAKKLEEKIEEKLESVVKAVRRKTAAAVAPDPIVAPAPAPATRKRASGRKGAAKKAASS